MLARSHSLYVQKGGSARGEYEDAFAKMEKSPRGDIVNYRYAIADGATESSYSGVWANLLVEAAVCNALGPYIDNSLQRVQQQWQNHLPKQPIQWFAEEKAREGAFAAILMLNIESNGDTKNWRLLSIGDCCLFQIRAEKTLKSSPFELASQFNNRPYLLGSNPLTEEEVEAWYDDSSNTWEPGDLFLLMTDALACWFLAEQERGTAPIERILSIIDSKNPQDQFVDFVEDERKSERLRNDDTTLVWIKLDM